METGLHMTGHPTKFKPYLNNRENKTRHATPCDADVARHTTFEMNGLCFTAGHHMKSVRTFQQEFKQ
jgi:hypothetical protein